MSYKGRIKHLEEMHKLLDKQINEMQTNHPGVDVDHLAELKKKKLDSRYQAQIQSEIKNQTKQAILQKSISNYSRWERYKKIYLLIL